MDSHRLEGLQGLIALVTVAVGVAGLGESGLRRTLEAWIDVHALFALLLCGLVLIRRRCCIANRRVRHEDPSGLVRHLCRGLYLIIFLVLGTKEVLGVLQGVWHRGAVGFSPLDASIFNGPDRVGWNPHDDFQAFMACALFAWLFTRSVAFRTSSSRAG